MLDILSIEDKFGIHSIEEILCFRSKMEMLGFSSKI